MGQGDVSEEGDDEGGHYNEGTGCLATIFKWYSRRARERLPSRPPRKRRNGQIG